MRNESKTLLSAMMCLLLFGVAGCTKQLTTRTESTGVISFYFSDGTLQCTFPAANINAQFPEDPFQGGNFPCKHLEDGGYIQLREVPSATRIWLVNGKPKPGQQPPNPKYCGLDDSVAFGWSEVKTIKQPTTSPEKLRIEDIKTHQIGDVIVPGLVLVDYHMSSSAAKPDEVNCVIIEVSP